MPREPPPARDDAGSPVARTSFRSDRRSWDMAERGGFEPPIRLPVCRISSAVHSTTLPPLPVPDARWSRAGAVIAACVARDKGSGGDISRLLVDFPAVIAYPPMVPKSAQALLDAPALAARDALPLDHAFCGVHGGFTGPTHRSQRQANRANRARWGTTPTGKKTAVFPVSRDRQSRNEHERLKNVRSHQNRRQAVSRCCQ
jgi:hypothetical protein